MKNQSTQPTEPTQPIEPIQLTAEESKAIIEPVTTPIPVSVPTPVVELPKTESLAHKINRIMAFVLIVSAIAFVLISILSIWEVFGPDAGTVVWRSLGSLGAIALGALIISIASKLIDDRQHG